MRKILYGIVGLVFVLVAVALLAPHFIDLRSMLAPALQAVKESTGREVRVGDVGLSLFPPTATLSDLRVANIPGAAEPDMLRVKAVEVSVALMPLLSRRVEVQSVTIVDPVVTIETLKDGRSSLDFPKGKPGDSGGGMDIALQAVSVKSGTVVLRDAAGGQRRIEALNLTGSAGSLGGPLAAKGTARALGVQTALDVSVGRIEPGKPANVSFVMEGAGAKAQFTGTVTGAAAAGQSPAIAGKFAVNAANLGELARAVNAGGGTLPPMAAQPFTMEGAVKGTTTQVTAPEIAITLGETRGAGALAFAFSDKTTVQLALNIGRLDLDKLLAQGATAGAAPATPPATPPAGAPPAGAPTGASASPFPPNLVAAIDIGIEGIAYRGQAMQKARLQVDIVGGAAVVKQLTAQLPAASNVLVANLPLPLGGPPPAMQDGRIEAHSGNLRALLEWLGTDLSSLPPQRLGRFDMKAGVKSDGTSVQIANLDATIDNSRLTGGATMAWRDRPALAVRANVDKLNLDAYMPVAPAAKPARMAQAPSAPGSGATGLRSLDTFDLNLGADIDSLTYRDTPIQGVKMTVELVNGRLAIKEATVRDLAGAQAAFTLVVERMSTAPAFSTAFNLRATDAKRFLKFASGYDSPLSTQALGQLNAKGTVAGTMDGLKVDTTLEGFGGAGKIVGSMDQLGQAVPKVDLAIDASFPEFGPVLGALAGAQAKQGNQALGPFVLKSRIANTGADAIALKETELRAFGGELGLTGTITQMASPAPAVDLGINMKLPSLKPLLVAFNPDPQLMATADKLGGITLTGKAVGNAQKVTLRDAALTGLGGSIKLNGDVVQSGKQLDLAADMQNFTLGPLLAAMPGVITAQGAQQLGPVNGRLALKGGMDNLSVGMQNLAMQGFGGTMALNGQVSDAMDPTRKADLTFDVANLAVGPMLAAFPNAGVSPTLAQNLQTLTAKGSIKGSTDAPSLTLQQGTAQAFGGTLALTGTVTEATTPSAKYDMTASANLPSLMTVLSSFYKPEGSIPGPVKFDNVRLTGDGKRVQIANLNGQLGNIGVTGQGVMTMDGPRPKLDLQVQTTGDILLDAFQSADPQKRGSLEPYWHRLFPELSPASLGDTQLAQAQARPLHPRWSKEPLRLLATIKSYDASVALSGQAIVDGPYRVVNPQVKLAVANGVATLERLSGALYDGQITILGKLAATEPPNLSMQMQVRGLNIAKAAQAAKAHQTGRKWFLAFGRIELIEGLFDADLNYNATGRSEAEMVQTLAGTGGFQATNGVIEGIDMAKLSNTLKSLNNVLDIASVLTQTTSGGRTRFQLINSSNEAKAGLVSSGNLMVKADAMDGRGGYNLDFPSYTMNARLDVTLTEHAKTPPVILTAVGPIDNPVAHVDSDALKQHVLGNATKFIIRQLNPGQATGEGGQANPADLLKGVLGGQPAPAAPAPGQAAPPAQKLDPQQLLQQLLKPKAQ
ncbi:MAG: AsmA family protein [Alphaproteobacteria bacterium]|nr:AsmA family protein [Alphaproteobacteria bacterium]